MKALKCLKITSHVQVLKQVIAITAAMITIEIIKSFVAAVIPSAIPTIFDEYVLQTVPEPEETFSDDTECKEKRKQLDSITNTNIPKIVTYYYVVILY